jgi:histidine phosphotransferase ChpT
MMNISAMQDALRLAELLANRLCHDLSGPLNGLGAGLSEAVAGSSMAAEGLSLAQEAAAVAIHRLILLRAAWGQAGESFDRAALERLAAGLPGRRLKVDCSRIADGVVFPPMASRLLLNVMLLAAESLPRGGTIMLQGDPASGVVAMIDGPQAAWPDCLPGLIAAPDSACELLRDAAPRDIQAPLTVLMAAGAGQRLSLLLGTTATSAPPLLVSQLDR